MKAKRTILSMLIMFLLIALIPAQVRAEEDTNIYSFGHFYYHSHNGYVSICGYLGRETEVEIPSVMSGRPVSEIESGSFQGCNTIETIIVPDTVVMVYEDSFTGASSIKKIISHTVGVDIKADSGVTIQYVNDDNHQPEDETNSSKPVGPSEETNPSDGSIQPIETKPKEDNPGGSGEPGIAVPTNKEPGNKDASEIGDYVYEETDEKTDTGLDNASFDTTPNLPNGIHIPDSDIVVTVDENDNLVQVDSKGNKIVLDSEKKYQIEENEDGTVKIVDADGKEVKVTDEGNVLFGDMDEEEVVDNEGKRPIILWVAVILGIAVVAVAAGFVVKKKMKKK